MRIGISAPFLGKRHSGIATYTENLAQCVRGLECELVLYSAADAFSASPGVVLRPTAPFLQAGAGSASSFARFGWTQAVLRRHLKRDLVRLLICPSVEGLLNPPVPQVIAIHDLIPLFYREENPRQYHFYKRLLPAIIRRSCLVLTISEHTKDDIIRLYGVPADRVVVAMSGIDLFATEEDPEGTERAPERYFIYVGTFAPRKNLATVVRAFAEVAKSVPERLVVVAYPDKWQPSLEALASNLGVLSRIEFLHHVRPRRLGELYKNATAAILLSEYEGFGLPPVQAMALGTPALVSDRSSLAEVTRGGAIQVPCKDVRAAAEAMWLLSQDREFRKRYSEMGRRKATEYEAPRCAERLRSALQPLVEGLRTMRQTGRHLQVASG